MGVELLTKEGQVAVLANYIVSEIPGEPCQSEGAGTTAVRLLKEYRKALVLIVEELGQMRGGYYQTVDAVDNAFRAAKDVLDAGEQYDGIEGFVPELGATVRECMGCGCLVPGGPTRCKRCARESIANE